MQSVAKTDKRSADRAWEQAGQPPPTRFCVRDADVQAAAPSALPTPRPRRPVGTPPGRVQTNAFASLSESRLSAAKDDTGLRIVEEGDKTASRPQLPFPVLALPPLISVEAAAANDAASALRVHCSSPPARPQGAAAYVAYLETLVRRMGERHPLPRRQHSTNLADIRSLNPRSPRKGMRAAEVLSPSMRLSRLTPAARQAAQTHEATLPQAARLMLAWLRDAGLPGWTLQDGSVAVASGDDEEAMTCYCKQRTQIGSIPTLDYSGVEGCYIGRVLEYISKRLFDAAYGRSNLVQFCAEIPTLVEDCPSAEANFGRRLARLVGAFEREDKSDV